ncbi:restriction endonuclease subunit S [Spongiibacter marinus]|uniref:restriction endonuclease subunit S n=1 Tax=Spongiibacter marinus TaxID=354246 RepID=UPI0035BE35E6
MKITKKVGEIASIQVGHAMRGSIPEVFGAGIYMVQPRDINEYGKVFWGDVVETELRGKAEPRWLEPGDVLFKMNGKPNLAAYIDRIELPENAKVVAHHQFFHLKVTDRSVDPEYLAWYFNYPRVQEQIEALKMARSTGPVVNKGMLSDLGVVIPERKMQDEILELWYNYVNEQRILRYKLEQSTSSYLRSVDIGV